MRKTIPTGVSSFEKIRTVGGNGAEYYYVDKTMMIKELLYPKPVEVTLITRPRRFGKSLNMSMLECFLDIERESEGTSLFDGLAIMNEKEVCDEYMHKYPVIHVSFKDAVCKKKVGEEKKELIEAAMKGLKGTIGTLAERYRFLLSSDKLDEADRISFRQISTRNPDTEGEKFLMSDDNLETALLTLSMLLKKHYGKPAVILIDEYDVPLNAAFELGCYEYFIGTYRSILSAALKENDSLAFAVVTGCLKISKESIFTGLNHLDVRSVVDPGMNDFFGFDDDEVGEMLEYYGLGEYREGVRRFYDGYRFGSRQAYNPWAVLEFASKALDYLREGQPVEFGCGWIKTSGNDILYNLMEKAEKNLDISEDVDALENGGTITKRIIDQLTFDNMYDSIDGIWTVMLHAGYLTIENRLGNGVLELRIPNEEVLLSFDDIVAALAKRQAGNGMYQKAFCDAVTTFDVAKIEEALNDVLENSVSIRDTATREPRENFYHGVMNAILLYRDGWSRRSNPEVGKGYCDILVENPGEDWGVLFELKYSDDKDDFTAALDEGQRQIVTCKYAKPLKRKRYANTHLYAIAFHGKECKVREVFA